MKSLVCSFLIIVLFLVSCNVDETPTPSGNTNNNVTPCTTPIVSANVGSIAFSSCEYTPWDFNSFVQFSIVDTSLIGGKALIYLSLKKTAIQAGASVPLTDPVFGEGQGGYRFINDAGTINDKYFTDDTVGGFINIAAYDSISKTISGSFSFTAQNDSNQTVNVTNGVFNDLHW